jgi:dethiobiotin synthetase
VEAVEEAALVEGVAALMVVMEEEEVLLQQVLQQQVLSVIIRIVVSWKFMMEISGLEY